MSTRAGHTVGRATMAALAAVAVAVSGCGESSEEGAGRLMGPPDGTQSAAQTAAERAEWRGSERAFFALAQEVPAFGGYFLNEGKELVVYLTDVSQADAMRRALVPFFRELVQARGRVGGTPPEVVIRPGDYTFLELDLWRTIAEDEVLPMEGVVLIDLDEKANQVTVGLRGESYRSEVEARVGQLDVPAAAVRLQVYGTPTPLANDVLSTTGCNHLQGTCRPLIGGYQTTFYKDGSQAACTIMAPAIWGGDTVFVTAAHCSETEWDIDGEVYYQPSAFSQVGVETLDPKGWHCSTFSLYVCRYSDALLAAVDSDDSADVGFIARTTGVGNGSLYVSSTQPRLTIRGASDVYGGETIYMIGRTSGWIKGKVTETCVSYEKSNYHRVVCTDVGDHNAAGGDSGSPTFLWGGSDTITLVGLTFARVGFYDHTFFSPISGIQQDLGSLEFRAEEYRGTSDGGGGGGGGTCDFDCPIME